MAKSNNRKDTFNIVEEVLLSSNIGLRNEFVITDDMLNLYLETYKSLTGTKGIITPKELKYAKRQAALSLVKYKRTYQLDIQEGFLYVISNKAWPSYLKIGMTVEPYARLAAYQTYSPLRDFNLERYRFFYDRRAAEKRLLNLLSSNFTVINEWVISNVNELSLLLQEMRGI